MLGEQDNLPITVSGLAKVAIFSTKVDAKNQTLITHKCICGEVNRHFCQARVIHSAISTHCLINGALKILPFFEVKLIM
jgi:hypothetical protein